MKGSYKDIVQLLSTPHTAVSAWSGPGVWSFFPVSHAGRGSRTWSFPAAFPGILPGLEVEELGLQKVPIFDVTMPQCWPLTLLKKNFVCTYVYTHIHKEIKTCLVRTALNLSLFHLTVLLNFFKNESVQRKHCKGSSVLQFKDNHFLNIK